MHACKIVYKEKPQELLPSNSTLLYSHIHYIIHVLCSAYILQSAFRRQAVNAAPKLYISIKELHASLSSPAFSV